MISAASRDAGRDYSAETSAFAESCNIVSAPSTSGIEMGPAFDGHDLERVRGRDRRIADAGD